MTPRLACAIGLTWAVCGAGRAAADPLTLRMAAIAPEGTAWARELKAFARDVRASTGNQVQVKWYLGAIAGDELTAVDRIRRGQLDGTAGALFCQKLSPTLRVTRVIGLFDSRQEVSYVLGRLRPSIDHDLQEAGLVSLGVTAFGSDLVFSRRPITSLAALRHQRLWVWDLDDVLRAELKALGLDLMPLPPEQALAAYESGRTDGFIGVSSAALAFQWSASGRYFANLRFGIMPACIVVATHSFDALSLEAQQAVRTAATKLQMRFGEVGYAQDDLLTGRLFASQGLTEVAVSPQFQAEFAKAARAARSSLPESLLPHALIERVQQLTAEYRQEHHGEPPR